MVILFLLIPPIAFDPEVGPMITISNTDRDYDSDSDPDAELAAEAYGGTGHSPPLSV